MSQGYVYDSAFQNMASSGAAYAARRTISILRSILSIHSIIDLGCARGTWPRAWLEQGVEEAIGVDGDYVDRTRLEIEPSRFVVHDLAQPFALARRFDLAQSLEVAEHLPAARAAGFVADLVTLAPVVLFSAAPPGPGGEYHINEQPYENWRRLFARHDYVPIDCLRPALIGDSAVPAWYRYNMVLYVIRPEVANLPEEARQFQIGENDPIRDLAPMAYKVRKRIMRVLPRAACDQLARLNARRYAESGI